MIDQQVTVLKSAYAHVGFCRGKMATTGIKMTRINSAGALLG